MSTVVPVFDPVDATDGIQDAIDSGAREVRIPYVGADWIVRPITLASDQAITFDPGVVVAAKAGEFLDPHDALFEGIGVNNVRLEGYGATLRMRRAEYVDLPGEWRHTLALKGAMSVGVSGLAFEQSGGDGI